MSGRERRTEKDVPPLIGIPIGHFEARGAPGKLGINRSYVDALRAAGAVVVLIPSGDPGGAQRLVERLDGLLIAGGLDVHPRWYGEVPQPFLGKVDEDLDELEFAAARTALEIDIPILGICRGMQVLNVAHGGTLYQDLRQQRPGSARHRTPQSWGRDHVGHDVILDPGSRLVAMIGATCMPVNTFHHQAIRELGTGLRVVGTSPDGVIEAIESALSPLVAVQCHPEELRGLAWADQLFTAFVALVVHEADLRRSQ